MKKVENQLAFFSPWICGKDCNIPEASWSDSHISLSLYLSLSALLRLLGNNLF